MAEVTADNKRGRRNEVVGMVVSDKMDKTISVQVTRLEKHTRYGKYVKKHSVFKAHDETNKAKEGDKVKIFEGRRLSKTKCWRLAEVVEEARKVGE